jgi:hypothetical protein
LTYAHTADDRFSTTTRDVIDCLAPNRHPPGLDGHRSVRLVERYQAFDVACIHAFHTEALKVLGLNCGYVRHRARLPACVPTSPVGS